MKREQQQQPSTDIDVSVSIIDNSIYLPFCVYNASGPRSGTIEALQKVASSKSGAILTKSATLLSQTGNPTPRIYHSQDQYASFNSEGLPNNGIDYYISNETISSVLDHSSYNTENHTNRKKPYIVSLSGKTLQDNCEMIRRIAAATAAVAAVRDTDNTEHQEQSQLDNYSNKIAAIELNVACPNIIGKAIIGYDMNQLQETVQQITSVIQECNTKYQISDTNYRVPPLGIKLPPYLDMYHFVAVADIINPYRDTIRYVVSMNTMGNALCIDGRYMETPYIASNDGYAGMSGPAVQYTALANVRKLRQVLHTSIDIIGVGGITTGQDIYDMILCGAKCCQVGTTHWKEGSEQCFDRLHREFISILQKKGYTNISQFYNTLQPYSKERAILARQLQLNDKDDKVATNTNSNNNTNADVQFYKTLSMILTVLLAMVVSYQLHTNLLPTEL